MLKEPWTEIGSVVNADGLMNTINMNNEHEVVRITKSIKTLILEIMGGQGPAHIREVHLQVLEFRPDVPQHTVRARLSEMSRSDDLEEKLQSLGSGFYGLYEEDKNLSSVVSYPDRGPWGDSAYRGNCSGHLVKDLILRFKCQSVFDPSEGGGTVRDVVSGINQYLRRSIAYYSPGPPQRLGYPDRRLARKTI